MTVGGNDRENLIAFNATGIRADSGSGNTLAANHFLANSGLAIDLADDGVTANDLNDTDTGPNNLQNFPELTLAQQRPVGLRLVGRLDVPIGSIAETYRLSIYESAGCDPSGHGEGTLHLAVVELAFTHLGAPLFIREEDFDFTLGITPSTIGAVITLTATAPDGSTSEFSRCRVVVGNDQLLRDGFEI